MENAIGQELRLSQTEDMKFECIVNISSIGVLKSL